ncbi:MAG: Eco57I restriction-modification methylase domain-containing protein [Clostridia bacterium]|nr:Eco57I restriction-modification methylase domain-containing protein [Clostridia bacterium]
MNKTICKKAKLLYQRATESRAEEGEEAVYRYYMEEALKDSFSCKDAFYCASYYFQAYNNDRRAKLNKKKMAHGRIDAAEIPAVTQLFTPLPLAEYITENSLGRLLYECGINLDFRYLGGVSKKDFAKRKTDIRKIRILDPAVGTGNLLFCAAKLMVSAYRKLGYSELEIGPLLSANFLGLDIEDRATTLCKYLLNREFGTDFNIVTLRSFAPDEIIQYQQQKEIYDGLLHLGERGSVSLFPQNERGEVCDDVYNSEIRKTLSIFGAKYDIILMNPPYLASSDCGKSLLEFIKSNYAEFKTDLFAVFIARSLQMLKADGYMGVVCPFNWMFTKQFIGLRRHIFSSCDIKNLAMLPADDYKEAVVYLSCFVLSANCTGEDGHYIKIEKGEDSARALQSGGRKYTVNRARYNDTPYNSIIFWTGDSFIWNYRKGKLQDVLEIRQGLATGDNKKYLVKIAEVDASDIANNAVSIEDFDRIGKPYALYNKGGPYRKWYGNIDYAIRFDKETRKALSKSGNRLPSKAYYFKPCLTWTLVSSKGYFGARLSNNSVFDVGGSCGFPKKDEDIFVILGYLCSTVATAYLNAQNPTINCQVGDIKNLPYLEPSPTQRARIEELVKENVAIARADWHYTVPPHEEEARNNFIRLKRNEEELNTIFIHLYGLEEELSCEVPDRLITLQYR